MSLDKFYLYGIRGTAPDWITNYLSDRKQYVVYKSTKSDEKHITRWFHRVLSWDLFYFYCTLMLFAMHLTFFFLFYLQMIPIYF